MLKTAVLMIFASTAAVAQCPQGAEALVSCSIKGSSKYLQTCLAGDTVTYAFGRKGQPPELEMSRHVRDVDFTPWPGVGRWIWEEFTLQNGAYSYIVSYAFERNPEAMTITGGVTVWRDDQEIASLECDPDDFDFSGFASPIFDAKIAAGQVWDFDSRSWISPQ